MSKKKQFFKHLLKSILIAFSLAVVYALIVPALITGMYAELFHFFVAIGLFFGSIIFYFIFLFFRSIKKLPWLFGGIAVWISIVVIANSDVDIYYSNLFNSNYLPKQYNHYQDIKQPLLQFENKEMRLVSNGSADLECYLTKQNNLIVGNYDRIDSGHIDQKIYYKFDNTGNIIAKYKPSNDAEILFEGYLINVNENYYRTWAFDNDTLKRKIEMHNENLGLDAEKQDDFITDIEQNADFFFSKNYYQKIDGISKKIGKIFFLKSNNWNVFYNDKIGFSPIKSKVSKELFRHYSVEKAEWVPNYNENIQYQYFQKIKLKPNNLWVGYLYTKVIIDKDTLKIKEALSMDNEWKNDQVKIDEKIVGNLYRKGQSEFLPYLYYSNPKLQYQLFSNHLGKLYIIKNK